MEKISYPELFEQLLAGAMIVEIFSSNRKRNVYKVRVLSDSDIKFFHITPGMFESLCDRNLLISDSESCHNKYGEVFNFYRLLRSKDLFCSMLNDDIRRLGYKDVCYICKYFESNPDCEADCEVCENSCFCKNCRNCNLFSWRFAD